MQRFEKLFEDFADIITNFELFEASSRYDEKKFKYKIDLIDGSNLRIYERWRGRSLERYGYYWLDESNTEIIGWDNAPHHPEISTYPHHKHLGAEHKTTSSNERKLEDVLKVIQSLIS